ncbi:MAG: hypothetical protein ABFR90_06885 [Planctomycetota bacterium]
MLLKENRCAQALWILLPIVIFRLLWVGLATLMHIPSEASSMFVSLIDCLLIGFVLNWLLGERIGNRNRFMTWLLALGVFGLTVIAFLADLGTGFEAIYMAIFIGLTVGILFVSFPLAGFMCRKKFGPIRFSIWVAVWTLLMTMGFFTVFAVIQAMMSKMSFMMIFLQVLMVSLIYAGILIVGLLPFEILLFVNCFWRKRFEAVFGLKAKAAAIESIQVEESPDSEMLPAE